MERLKAADYSGMGENYRKYRKGYSDAVLKLLISHIEIGEGEKLVADIGAGTGIWSRQMALCGLRVIAVEPNEDMRKNGMVYTRDAGLVSWREGAGEQTTLDDKSVNWVTMASAFHWTDPKKSLPEFHRILADEGYLTLLWNPLVREGDELQERVEKVVQLNLGTFSRVFRSGENAKSLLTNSGLFKDVLEIRHTHYVGMSAEEYINGWRSANHFKAEAERQGIFEKIIDRIRDTLGGSAEITVPYETRSWTARVKK